MTNIDPSSIATLKLFVIFLGLPTTIGMVLSQVAEHLDAFQKLSSTWKMAILFATSVLMPVLSRALLTYVPDSTFTALDPWYGSILQGALVFVASQYWHAKIHGAVMSHQGAALRTAISWESLLDQLVEDSHEDHASSTGTSDSKPTDTPPTDQPKA